uniref:uncharacterized protein n=1 Tax=Myxine glutinosa TaxID=7769 RepID=UPI00358EF380
MVHLNKAEALVNWVNCVGDLNICSLVQLVELSPFMEIITRANGTGTESSFPFHKDTKEKLKFIREYLQNHFRSNPCIDALDWTWSTDQGNVEMNLAKLTVAIMCCSFTSRGMQHKMESLGMETQVELRSLLQFVLEHEGCTALSSDLEEFLNHGDQVVTMNDSPSPLIPTKPMVHFKEHLHSSPAKRPSQTPPSPVWDFFRRAPLQISKLQQDLVERNVAKDALEIELHSRTLLLQHKDKDVCRLQDHIQQLQDIASSHPPTPPPLDQLELRRKSERLQQVMLQVRDLRQRLSSSERQADRLMVENDALATKLRYQESILRCQRVRLRATVRSARSEYRAWQARCAGLQRSLASVTDERDCLAERLEILQNKLTSLMTSHEPGISRPEATALEEVAALGVMAQLGNCGFGIDGALGWSECFASPDIMLNVGDLKQRVPESADEHDAINSKGCIKENHRLVDCASPSDDTCVESPLENSFCQSGKQGDCNNCKWLRIIHGVDRDSHSSREIPAETCALSAGEKVRAGNLTCCQGKSESFSVHSIHRGTGDDMGLAAHNENVNAGVKDEAGGSSVDDETNFLHEYEWKRVECEAEKANDEVESASTLDEVDKVKSIKVMSEDGVEDTKMEYEYAGSKDKADIQPRDVCSGRGEVDVCRGVGDIDDSSAGGDIDVGSAGSDIDVGSAGDDIDVGSAGGDIDVGSAGGDIDVGSAGGDIDVGSAGGDIDVGSAGGDIDVGSAGGDIDVGSAAGDIDVCSVDDDVHVGSAGGDIDVGSAAGDIDVFSAGGDVDIGSAGGDIDVCSVDDDVDVGSVGVDIDVCSAGGDIDVYSAGGDVDVCSVDDDVDVGSVGVDIDVGSAGGDIDVCRAGGDIDIGSAGGDIDVGSAGGDIDIGSAGGDIDVGSAGGDIDIGSAGGDIDVGSAGGDIDIGSAGGDIDVCSAGGDIDVCSAGGDVDVYSVDDDVDVGSAGGDIDVGSAGGDVDVFHAGSHVYICRAGDDISLFENNALNEHKEYPELMEGLQSEKVAQNSNTHVMDEASRVGCILVQSNTEMIVEDGCQESENDDVEKHNQAETRKVEQERVSKNSAEDVECDFWATALGTPSENDENPSRFQTLHRRSPAALEKRHFCGVAHASSSKLDRSDGSICFRHGDLQRHLGAEVDSWASFPLPLASSPTSVQESPWQSREDWPSFTPNASLPISGCKENCTSSYSYYTPQVSAINGSVHLGDRWSARLPGYRSERVHCKITKLVRATRGLQCVDEPEELDFGQLSHSAGEGHLEKQGQGQCRFRSPNAGGTNAPTRLPCYPESVKRSGVDSQSQAGKRWTKGILKPSNVDPEFVVKTPSRHQLAHFLRFMPSRKSRKIRGLKAK